MRFVAVRIENFRSFRKAQEFVFPEEPGLYFMQGSNEAEPRLEGNGAGKSTIWEAITWCIFGKTSRGLKAGDISHWEAGKGTWVEIDFITNAGESGSMRRSWKPNAWGLEIGGIVQDLGKGDANWFQDVLRLEFEPWLNCILMAQNQPMFLDLKADAQAALFSDVMGLDRWLQASQKASTRASAQDAVSRGLERDLAAVEARLEAVQRDDLKEASAAWERERAEKLGRLQGSYEQALEAVTAKSDIKDAEAAEIVARARLRELLDEAAPGEQNLASHRESISSYRIELALAEKALEQAREHQESINENKPCPTCGLTMMRAERSQALAEAGRKLFKLEAKVDNWRKSLSNAEAGERSALAAVQKLRDEIQTARDRVTIEESEAKRVRNAYERDQRALDEMEAEHKELQAAVNPHEALLARAEREAKQLRIERYDLRHSLESSQEKQSLYSMWVRGFKELRLQLIAEALTELEIEVNSCVAALGLNGWELNFQVDREGKGGGIQRGFSVLVRAPGSAQLVPFAAWSGGEGQRLRLAGNMGLSDLIRSRTGSRLDLEVWDEPTQGLSPQGVQDLLESLRQRAQTEQRQVWIVDHRTYSFGGFAGGATIVKTPSGSRIRQV